MPTHSQASLIPPPNYDYFVINCFSPYQTETPFNSYQLTMLMRLEWGGKLCEKA